MPRVHYAAMWNLHWWIPNFCGHASLSEVKLKESRNRPGVAQRVSVGLGFQIFMTFGT